MVEIERRLFRDGQSEYLINGRTARLRDIRDLFLDTGIGADAYSIIEQGKVDAMLLASPQERRTIFEEAAGIAKYKQRRLEAQRKLERAQANLVTTRDQLDATERRLRLVRGQAAKARKYRDLDGDLRAWRMALAFEQNDDLIARVEGLTSAQAELQVRRDAAHAALSQTETRKQDAEVSRHERAGEQRRLEQERLQAEHAGHQAEQRPGHVRSGPSTTPAARARPTDAASTRRERGCARRKPRPQTPASGSRHSLRNSVTPSGA